LLGSFLSLPRIVPHAAFALCAAVALGACGSSDGDTQHFAQKGFAITFDYPGKLERVDRVSVAQTSRQAENTFALALTEQSGILVQRYRLAEHTTELEARRELEGVLRRMTGATARGEPIAVGDRPAFRYEVPRLRKPRGGRSTVVVVIDRRTEYFINCQSVPADREEIDSACEQVIGSLAIR
jgi:hypothetical protein